MPDRSVDVGGISFHVRDHPGGEPVIAILPGLTVSGGFFDALLEAGLSPPLRAVAIDLRGRGRSDVPIPGLDPDRPAAGYTMADHAADVLGILDGLNIPKSVLVGHSYGGMLAIYLAANRPDRFDRVVLLDAALELATERTRLLLEPSISRLDHVKPSWGDYLAALRRQPFVQGCWDPGIEAYFRDDSETDPAGRVRHRARMGPIRAALEGMLAEDWRSLAGRVAQAVLLLRARDPFGPPGSSPLLSPEAADETVEALADCRCIEVDGNHFSMAFGANARGVAGRIVEFCR